MKLDLTALYCKVDDFCQEFVLKTPPSLSLDGIKRRNKHPKLKRSEIITILIFAQTIRFRDFKTFYLTYYKQLKSSFPHLVSYSRFVQLMPRVTLEMMAFTLSLRGQCSGYSFIDSTPLQVCKKKRISRNKVFKGIAKIGKSTIGWFHGFKLHLVINERGEVLSFHVTAGNVDDRKPVPSLVKDLWGKLYADKGYISKPLAEKLAMEGVRIITSVKSNMKNRLLSLQDKLLLRKRSIIETVNDQLKNISEIEHSRHRSPQNFMLNLLAGLSAYMLQPVKPSLSTLDSFTEVVFS